MSDSNELRTIKKCSPKLAEYESGAYVQQQHRGENSSGQQQFPPNNPIPSKTSYEYYVSCIPVQHRSKLDCEVDFENNGVDLHLGEIAEVLEEWEDVAPALGLTGIEISDILDSQMRPCQQRKAALKKWKSNNFGYQSTYGSLLRIFTTSRRFKCAEKIVKLLGGNGNPTQAPPPSTYSGSGRNYYGLPAEYTDGGGGASLPVPSWQAGQPFSASMNQHAPTPRGYQPPPPPPSSQHQHPPSHSSYSYPLQGAAGYGPSAPNGRAVTNGNTPHGGTDSTAQPNQVSPTVPGSSRSPPVLQIRSASTAAYSSASSDGLKKNHYEAESRGLNNPKLKLGDNDRDLTEIHPRPIHISPKPMSGYYDMTADFHGVAIIINNKKFTSDEHQTRNGTERDEYNLHQTFKFLGYRLVIFTDLTSTEMMDLFNKLDHYLKTTDEESKNQVAHDSFICCILSHGGKGVIYGSDSKSVKREDIERAVGKSKTLLRKPKLFFIQACRGEGTPEPVSADSGSVTNRSDMYFCMATAVGDKAFRHNERGSWFVTEVCKILCKFGKCYTFPDDFQPQLNANVAEITGHDEQEKAVMQQPVGINQLKQSIHFFHNVTQAPPPSTYSGSGRNDYGHPAEYTDGGGRASLPRQAARTVVERHHYGILCEKLRDCAPNNGWKRVAAGLRFTAPEIAGIASSPMHMSLIGAPGSYMNTVIGEWMEWGPSDARGSKDVATLEALKAALRQANFGRVALSLTLED